MGEFGRVTLAFGGQSRGIVRGKVSGRGRNKPTPDSFVVKEYGSMN